MQAIPEFVSAQTATIRRRGGKGRERGRGRGRSGGGGEGGAGNLNYLKVHRGGARLHQIVSRAGFCSFAGKRGISLRRW